MHYVALGLYRLVRVVKISSDLSRSDQSFPKYVGSSFCRKSSQDWNGIWTCILACLQCRRTMSVSLTILKCHRRLVSRIVYTCDILIHMWYSQCLEAISNYDLDLTLNLYRMTHTEGGRNQALNPMHLSLSGNFFILFWHKKKLKWDESVFKKPSSSCPKDKLTFEELVIDHYLTR